MRAPSSRFFDIEADGTLSPATRLTEKDPRVSWEPPAKGGELRYTTTITSRRNGGYDARLTNTWALLRFEDLFPSMTSKTTIGAESHATLHIEGPTGWSIETRYGRMYDQPLSIETQGRRLDQPSGWLIAGKLGVRRAQIGIREVVVAAPAGSRYPRVPTLAFLRWTLPTFVKVFPTLPPSVLIVSGDDSMWRGALSGPASLYLHPARPLISENATSTLLHELVHLATRWQAEPGDDWIVEGIAEFYALEILRRSGGIGEERFQSALVDLSNWAKTERAALTHPSKGADTAYAALLFFDLDKEIKEQHPEGLDLLMGQLLKQKGGQKLTRIHRDSLVTTTNKILERKSRVLSKALEELKD